MIVWALLTDYTDFSVAKLGSRIGTCNSFDTHFLETDRFSTRSYLEVFDAPFLVDGSSAF